MPKKPLIVSSIILICLFIFPSLSRAESVCRGLNGRILLQVEENGEAWYVSPQKDERTYLGTPADAWQVMRNDGLGVANSDLGRFRGRAPLRLAGHILLAVEDKGQAYYVNPVDCRLHYLGTPADAWQVMREQGLGISDSDLAKIPVNSDGSAVSGQEGEADINNAETDEVAPPIAENIAAEAAHNDEVKTIIENIIEEADEPAPVADETVVVEAAGNTGQSDPQEAETAAMERRIFASINDYRAGRGLAALAWNDDIAALARAKSAAMADGSVPFSHDGFNSRFNELKTALGAVAMGENIAYNYLADDPAGLAVGDWIKSDGHRENIEGNYDLTGIGVIRNAAGYYYFTQIFIR